MYSGSPQNTWQKAKTKRKKTKDGVSPPTPPPPPPAKKKKQKKKQKKKNIQTLVVTRKINVLSQTWSAVIYIYIG